MGAAKVGQVILHVAKTINPGSMITPILKPEDTQLGFEMP